MAKGKPTGKKSGKSDGTPTKTKPKKSKQGKDNKQSPPSGTPAQPRSPPRRGRTQTKEFSEFVTEACRIDPTYKTLSRDVYDRVQSVSSDGVNSLMVSLCIFSTMFYLSLMVHYVYIYYIVFIIILYIYLAVFNRTQSYLNTLFIYLKKNKIRIPLGRICQLLIR